MDWTIIAMGKRTGDPAGSSRLLGDSEVLVKKGGAQVLEVVGDFRVLFDWVGMPVTKWTAVGTPGFSQGSRIFVTFGNSLQFVVLYTRTSRKTAGPLENAFSVKTRWLWYGNRTSCIMYTIDGMIIVHSIRVASTRR